MDAAFIWKLSKLGRIGSNRMRFDDDFADRLNYQYTGVILFMFIGLIGIRQYVGKPIQCWIPQEFTRGWEEYAENYCWVANTYFTPLEHKLPLEPDRSSSMISYYQWAPIVLATQALMFYLPCLTWRICMGHSGFNVHRILQMAADANELMPDVTMKTVQMMARYLETCIQRQRAYRRKLALQAQAKASAAQMHLNQTDVQLINGKYQKSYEDNANYENRINRNTSDVPNSSQSDVNNGTLRTKKGFAPPPPLACNGNTQKLTDNSSSYSNQSYHVKPQKTLVSSSDKKPRPEPLCKRICLKICCLEDVTVSKKKDGEKNVEKQLEKSYKSKGDVSPGLGIGRRYGNFLFSLYLVVKIAYLGNAMCQIYLMEMFIGANTSFYGFNILRDLLNNKHWNASGHFPRVTFCSLQTKKLGANDHYELQCVLPLNLFLEKIYIFLWFWHVALVAINVFSIFVWIKRMFWTNCRLKFIRKYLKMMNALNDPKSPIEKVVVRAFVDHYLCADGVFLLRIISANCGELLAGDLASELWLSFNRLNSTSNNPNKVPISGFGNENASFRNMKNFRASNCRDDNYGRYPMNQHSSYVQSPQNMMQPISQNNDYPTQQITQTLKKSKDIDKDNSDDIV